MCPTQAKGLTQTIKVQKFSPVEMAKRQKQGLCYHFDDKYSCGHKYKEPKLFQTDATDSNSSDEDPSLEVLKEEAGKAQTENHLTATTDELVISLHTLDGISLPQTLKI